MATKKNGWVKGILSKIEKSKPMEKVTDVLSFPAKKYYKWKGQAKSLEMIDKSAMEESKGILKKLNKSGNFVGTTKVKLSEGYGSQKEKALDKIFQQVKEVRRKKYREKKLID